MVKKNGVIVEEYQYDGNGNRVYAKTLQGEFYGNYDNQDRLISYGNNNYTYTANGELLSKTTTEGTTYYTYDELGNLLSVVLPDGKTIEYIVDGLGRRIGKRVNGQIVQKFIYEGQLTPVAELDGNNNIVSLFIYATKINVPDYIIKGGEKYKIITDHLGSIRYVVRVSDGAVVEQIEYDSFGNVLYDLNPGFVPFGFAGGIYDKDTGLVRFGARDYDAEVGRWTAKDPILFSSTDYNLYEYVFNDPINLTDVMGLKGKCNFTEDFIKFINDFYCPLNELANNYDIDVKFLIALAGHESGWATNNIPNNPKYNLFGTAPGGGLNIKYNSWQESINHWGQMFGEVVRGATNIDDFIDKLQNNPKGKYNSADQQWKDKVKNTYKSPVEKYFVECENNPPDCKQ